MKRFTDNTIKNLRIKPKKYIEREDGSMGFAVRVLPSGSKTFLYIHNENKRKVETVLGVFPRVSVEDARALYERAKQRPFALRTLARNEACPLPLDQARRQLEQHMRKKEEAVTYIFKSVGWLHFHIASDRAGPAIALPYCSRIGFCCEMISGGNRCLL